MRNKLDFIFAGGAVKRYHTKHTLTQQNVGEHSFGVAWLVWLLTEGNPPSYLLMAALAHDLAESVTGDLPAPAKRHPGVAERVGELETLALTASGLPEFELNEQERRILKLADTLELLAYCVREIRMGNSGMYTVYANGLSYVGELAPLSNIEHEVFINITKGV